MKNDYHNDPSRSMESVNYFTGYNHYLRNASTEMFDMTNMSSDGYPFLSSRHKRGLNTGLKQAAESVVTADILIDGVLYGNAVIACSRHGTIDVYSADLTHLKTIVSELGEAQKMVIMGGYLVCFPSGYYRNLLNFGSTLKRDEGYIGASVIYDRPLPDGADEQGATGVTTFKRCTKDGVAISITEAKPENPTSGTYWSDNGSLKVYSESDEKWHSVVTNYTKMYIPADATVTASDLGAFFEGDILEIGEITKSGTKRKKQTFQFVSYESGDGLQLVLMGEISYSTLYEAQIYIERKRPQFDYVFECGNRLWGCYYGVGEDGEVINEIYASALGDFRNFYKYEGVSTDAWTASLGVPGVWTGAINYDGHPIFFKENAIVRVYGSIPSSFYTQASNYRGVKKGSFESLCVVNEVLYYLSLDGFVAYGGGAPQNIDEALHERFEKAVCGGTRGKLFCSVKVPDAGYKFLVYDTVRGMWHKEDNIAPQQLCSVGENLLIVQGGVRYLYGEEEPDFVWSCETARLGFDYSDYKYISRVQARFKLMPEYQMKVYISYDGGEWELCETVVSDGVQPALCEIAPVRCDSFRLKFEGKGEADLISFSYLIEEGSSNYEN